MKKFFFFLITISLAISGCKKNNDNPSDEDIKALRDLLSLAANTRSNFLENAPLVGGDPKLALLQTLDWVLQQEGVSDAYHEDSIYLTFEMTSGLSSMFWFNELAADGSSRFRGNGIGQLKAITANGDCENEIANKDVLIYAPGYDEFYYELKSRVPTLLQGSDIIENVHLLKNEEATIEKISTFSNYGLVLMETHGKGNMFMTGDGFSFNQADIPSDIDQFRSELLNQIGEEHFDNLISGKVLAVVKANFDPVISEWWTDGLIALEEGEYVLWVKSTFLEGGPSLSNTVVFGNFCYSGWTTLVPNRPKPIGQAFLDLNPITYYAYQQPNGKSRAVDNLHSMEMEDSVIVGLLTDGDSTGVAHLKADGSTFQTTYPDLFLVHLGQPNWCYENCTSEPVAFGGNTYQTVCIGNQTWMAENLKSQGGTSVCYNGLASNCDEYGSLVDWQTAMSACPNGWHLPTLADWVELGNSLDGANVAGGKMKTTTGWDSPNVGATNSSGFNGVAAGVWASNGNGFVTMGSRCYLWTSETDPDHPEKSYFVSVESWTASLLSGSIDQDNKFSCRCVKD